MIPTRSRLLPLLFGAAALGTTAFAQDPPVRQDPPIPADKDPTTTASGLQYSVLEAGAPGESPRIGDRVKVHYTGWLTDGTLFDSSRKRGQPSEFTLGQVIGGWNEALQLMTPGARYKLTIPHQLAYGEAGRPPVIPAKATLVFDVELLSFTAMPRFRRPAAETAKKTESGLAYEIVEAGDGEPPATSDGVEFEYALWNTEGKLLQASAQGGGAVQGKVGDMELAFLREALPLLRAGGRAVVEVPPALAFAERDQGPDLPPGSVTVWELKLLRVHKPLPVPEFVMPADEDLVTTKSGLRYQVVREGDAAAAAPRMGEKVKVHYAGWLTDGTPFDDSFSRGAPAEFMLGQVIEGWNEGLQLMKPGAAYRLVIPAQLGYGEQGSPPKIGPSATLLFHVELLGVERR